MVEVSLRRKLVLIEEIKDLLVKYCLNMDVRFYGLSRKDCENGFGACSEEQPKTSVFSRKNVCRIKWLRSFLKHHLQLSLRKPQGISLTRIQGFSPENVKIFELYEPELLRIKSQPHRLYNIDETGMTIVQHMVSKVVILKGQMFDISGRENLITVREY